MRVVLIDSGHYRTTNGKVKFLASGTVGKAENGDRDVSGLQLVEVGNHLFLIHPDSLVYRTIVCSG